LVENAIWGRELAENVRIPSASYGGRGSKIAQKPSFFERSLTGMFISKQLKQIMLSRQSSNISSNYRSRYRGPCPPPWIFILDTDKVKRGLMVLFFSLDFSVAPLPGNFSADALGSNLN